MGFGNDGGSVCHLGVSVHDAGILSGARCAVCTLGGVESGAHVGGVVRSGTLRGIRRVDSNCVGRVDGSAKAVSLLSSMVELKMVDSCWRS